PIPYVDASSSSAFRDKRKRIMVGAAGIMTEAFLAALAVWVWVNVEPGVVRSMAFNVMVIAGVSTLLFNGNPLLRYDAYYILSDLLEIPNLGSRSVRYIGYLLQRYIFQIEGVDNPVSTPGEAPWFVFYGLASFAYRLFIVIRIAMFVASKFFAIGVLLAGWGLFSMLIFPCFKIFRYVFTDPAMQRKRSPLILVGGIISIFLVILLLVPLPSFTVAEGVLRAPEKSHIYASTDGFVRRVIATPGERVSQGEPLVLCENPDLDTEVKVLEAQLKEYESRCRLSSTKDRTETKILMDEIERIKAELDRKRAQREELIIRSPGDGIFILPNSEDLPGRFLRRGMPLGFVVDFSKVTARIVVSQRDVDRVRTRTKGVTVRLAEAVSQEFPAAIKREVPAASTDLPSLALSREGGGSLALDPREKGEPKAFEKLFEFDIIISISTLKAIGERVFVRFQHAPEPLALRFYRGLRRTLLSKFSI
ncbi:MAG: peptidase M50, partial [Deltaproteobacteria bacterium]